MDPSGEYELLENCGGALGSLHRRVECDGPPLFFFLDPSRTGHSERDAFVFSADFGRVGYGEVRRTIGDLDAAWRPWAAPPSRCVTVVTGVSRVCHGCNGCVTGL